MREPCPNCSHAQTFTDLRSGETICAQCGLVREGPPLVVEPGYEAGDSPTGRGPATWSVSARPITPANADANGRPLSPGKRNEVWRLYREDRRALNRQARAGFDEMDIRLMAQRCGLPATAAVEAGRLHSRWRKEYPRQSGLRNEDCAAAAILMASRLHRFVVRTELIVSVTGCSVSGLWRAVNRLRRETGTVDPVTLNPGAEPFIVSIGAMFGVPVHVRAKARELLGKVKDFGYKPACFGAGAVFAAYKALGLKPGFGQREVALAVGTTDTCLRNAMRIILAAADPDRPPPTVIP